MPKNTKLVFVQSRQEYIDQCYNLYLEDDNWNLLNDIAPFSQEEFEEELQSVQSCPAFAIVEKDKVIAFCTTETRQLAKYCDIIFLVKKSHRNKGYGKELLNLSIEQIKKAGIADYIASFVGSDGYGQKLLLSLGFKIGGILPDRMRVFRDGQYLSLDQVAMYLKIK
jgi:ribosomal protein S18 acetylase RimI-like enzyme